MHPVDRAIAAYAQQHWGTFSYRVARELGASRTFIARRMEQGAWHRFAEGSFGFHDWPASYERSLWAALHAATQGTLVGGWAAAAIYAFTGFPRTKFELLVPHGTRHLNPIALVRQTRRMPEPTTYQGFPIPARERVLCDLARQVGGRRVGRALDDLLAANKVSLAKVQRTFLELASPAWPGLRVMAAVLAERGEEYVPTRSELERELRGLIATIPGVEVAYEKQIGDPVELVQQVDCVVERPRKLILEADGRTWHQRQQDMLTDRRRDRRAAALGYPTFRFLHAEIVGDRATVRDEIAAYLLGPPA